MQGKRESDLAAYMPGDGESAPGPYMDRKPTRREQKAMEKAAREAEKARKIREEAERKAAEKYARAAEKMAKKEAARKKAEEKKKASRKKFHAPSPNRKKGTAGARADSAKSRQTGRKIKKEKEISAQQSIPYREMGKDGICRVQDKYYSKTIRFYDINYQLAQNEDKNAIFENWCDFLNYFDSAIHFQLSFINRHSSMEEYESIVQIRPQDDDFDDVRMEYAQMLKKQLAKGNNGLVRTKYIKNAMEDDRAWT